MTDNSVEACRARPAAELAQRIAALEEKVSPGRRATLLHWSGTVFIPALFIPILLMLIKHYWIDLPSRTVHLQYTIAQTTKVSDSQGKSPYRVRIAVENTGKGQLDAGRAFIMVKFYGPIADISDQWIFPAGTYVVDKSNKRTDSCAGLSTCKVVLGHLAPKGTFFLTLISEHDLDIMPYVASSGLQFTPSSCKGLRPELERLCPPKPESSFQVGT